MEFQERTTGSLLTLFEQGNRPVLLLGAGCSIRSGILSTDAFVERAAAWEYARQHGFSTEDLRIRRSDWYPWLKSQKWFDESKSNAENYPKVVEQLLQPRIARKEFFTKILNPGIEPSVGYRTLAKLIGSRVFDTILTTNFDDLVERTCSDTASVHHLDVIRHSDQYLNISTVPTFAQLIFLHGDVGAYTDKNLVEEVNKIDDELVERIVPMLRDRPLIVVGYRGGEESIMRHLLLQNSSRADGYKHGIYWCVMEDTVLDNLPAPVVELARTVGANFQIVRITGFDQLMSEDLWGRVTSDFVLNAPELVRMSRVDLEVPDLFALADKQFDQLDSRVLKSRLLKYSEAMGIHVPQMTDLAWLKRMALDRDLIVQKDGKTYPTRAGFLLFAKETETSLSNVSVTINGDQKWLDYVFNGDSNQDQGVEYLDNYTISGNLWDQLDKISDIFSVVNKPFRLKGEVSKTVYPYPPIALKELLVNALVHRDYDESDEVNIDITPAHIQITNPGGLTREVANQLGEKEIEIVIKEGRSGIKGYRNPVVADLFYSSGAMDKAGSGLADVCYTVEQNGGHVTFGPVEDNRGFTATIYARADSISESTNTSKPETKVKNSYVTNVLELNQIPQSIWMGETEFRSKKDVYDFFGDEYWIPPFILHDKKVVTFYQLDHSKNRLRGIVDMGTVESYSVEEIVDTKDGEWMFVRLCNVSLFSYFDCLGLAVDKLKMRAYFISKDSENRSMKYQARIKTATRTVARKRVSTRTERVMYWEHKSFSFRIEKFNDVWGLVIIPGYVFTVDGRYWRLKNERINVLSTRKASRDYNSTVLNDLFFWLWALKKGNPGSFQLRSTTDENELYFENNLIGIGSSFPKVEHNEVIDDGSDYFLENQIENEIDAEIATIADEEARTKDEGSDFNE